MTIVRSKNYTWERFEKKKKLYICIRNFVYVFFFLFPFFFGYSFLLIIKGDIQSSILLCCFILVLVLVHLAFR